MARPSYKVEYVNKITLKSIKSFLSSRQSNTYFVNSIFGPLKSKEYESFSSQYDIVRCHISDFMRGNIRDGKRQGVSSLKKWAFILSNKKVYNEVKNNIKNYINSFNFEEINVLIELDKKEMPDIFVEAVELMLVKKRYDELILLLILWSVYGKDQIYLLKEIYLSSVSNIMHYNENNSVLLQRIVPSKPVFLGRENELVLMRNIILEKKYVFIQGMIGIGKSELAKQYAHKYREYYDTVIYAENKTGIMQLFNDNAIFTVTKPFDSDRLKKSDGIYENDREFYNRKFSMVRGLLNFRTLIIIDNADLYDERITDFLSGICDVIITTRYDVRRIYPDETILLREINDYDICRSVFYEYSEMKKTDNIYVDKIITHFAGHPLALEMSANQMRVSRISSRCMYEMIENHSIGMLKEKYSISLQKQEELNMEMHIKQLYNSENLSLEEEKIMKCLSILPESGIDFDFFCKACSLENYDKINNLMNKHMILVNDSIISVHPFISDIILNAFDFTIDDCGGFIKNIMHDFTFTDYLYSDENTKKKFYECISHIYSLFPVPTIENFAFYECAELMFSACCEYDTALRICYSMQDLYRNNSCDMPFRKARILCRTGYNEFRRNNVDYGIFYLETGIASLEELKEPDDEMRLFLSDAYEMLLDLYDNHTVKTEKYCTLIIDIRSRLKNKYDPRRVSCINAFCRLARLAIQNNDFHIAEEYIAKAEFECRENDASFIDINNAKSELEAKKLIC